MEVPSDIMADKAPNLISLQKEKLYVDKEVQCQLPSITKQCPIPNTSSCGCQVTSSNDQYHTNLHVKGDIHDEIIVGQVVNGAETNCSSEHSGSNSSLKSNPPCDKSPERNNPIKQNKELDVKGHFHTEIHITESQNNSFTFKIQSQNYNPTFQLDASATKEILLNNPDIVVKALMLSDALTFSHSDSNNKNPNSDPNVKVVFPDGDIKVPNTGRIDVAPDSINKKSPDPLQTIHKLNINNSSCTSLTISTQNPGKSSTIFCGSNFHAFTKICLRRPIVCHHCNDAILGLTAFVCQECSCFVDMRCRQEITDRLLYDKHHNYYNQNVHRGCVAILQEGLFLW